MKFFISTCFLCFGLIGCISPATQMLNNKYLDVNLASPEYSGIWTAASGGGLSTIKLNGDGKGVMCEDNGHSLNLYGLRNSNDLIYVQNGSTFKKITIDEKILHLKTTLSAFNVNLMYKGDSDLKLASNRCAKELKLMD